MSSRDLFTEIVAVSRFKVSLLITNLCALVNTPSIYKFTGSFSYLFSPRPFIDSFIWIKSPLTRLSSSLLIPHFFSLTSYQIFLIDVGIFVALACTFSMLPMSISLVGDQTCTAYSRCGLTSAVYRFFHNPETLLTSVFFNKPIILFALAVTSRMCSFQFISEVKYTPKSFSRYVFSSL